MSKKKRFVLVGLALFLAAAGAAAWFEPTGTVRGTLRGEEFFAGRPTSVWARALDSKDPKDQAEVPEKLKQGGAAAVPVLGELTRSDSVTVRQQAAALLGRIGLEAGPAAGQLVPLLSDPDPHVRAVAARALGEIRPDDPAVVAALVGRLDTDDRADVIRPLSQFKSAARGAVPQLCQIMATHPDEGVRWEAARTLGKIGPHAKSAVPALVKAMMDPAAKVREHAAEALGDIGPEAAVAVPDLVAVLDDPDGGVRRDAVRSLGQMGKAAAAALPAVEKCLADPEPKVREAAEVALRRIDPTRPAKTENQ